MIKTGWQHMKAEQGGKSMSKEFLTKIKSSSNQFTKAEKKVADFVLQNPKKVLHVHHRSGGSM